MDDTFDEHGIIYNGNRTAVLPNSLLNILGFDLSEVLIESNNETINKTFIKTYSDPNSKLVYKLARSPSGQVRCKDVAQKLQLSEIADGIHAMKQCIYSIIADSYNLSEYYIFKVKSHVQYLENGSIDGLKKCNVILQQLNEICIELFGKEYKFYLSVVFDGMLNAIDPISSQNFERIGSYQMSREDAVENIIKTIMYKSGNNVIISIHYKHPSISYT